MSSTDELRQEHAVDLAAEAPTDVTLDSSAAPGGAYDAPSDGRHGLTEHSHGGDVPQQSRAERLRSFDVAAFPVPSGREEEWRFTPLDVVGPALEAVTGPAGELDRVVEAGDLEVTTLAPGQGPRGSVLVPGDRAAVLAHAGSPQALHLRVPAEAQPAEPLRVTVTGTAGTRTDATLVVEAGHHSRAVVVLDHRGSGVHDGNVEVVVGDGAELTLVSLQMWDDDAVHLGQHDARVGRDARYRHVAVTLGGKAVRLNVNASYAGPGASAELLGVYFADTGQHLEHRSFVDHDAPHCRSNVEYKGALQGATAHTVWVGDVLIRAEAEGTETYELNRNLVLTEGARADSVPNLEIETGEIVGAGHASATGRFDDEQLFYLQARGIPEDVARRLVVRGFFADVVHRIGVPDVEESLMAAIDAELEHDVTAAAARG